MREFIKFEIIRNLKRKDIKLLLIVLIMCELILMTTMQKQSSNEDVFEGSSDWVATDAYFQSNTPEHLEKEALNDIEKLDNGLTSYYKYENEKEWDKMYLKAMEYSSYYGQVFAYDPDPLDEDERVLLQNANIVYDIQKKYNFVSIEDYTEIIDTNNNYHHNFPWVLHELQYFTSLHEMNLVPMTYSHIDSTTAFIQLLRNMLSLITPILAALLFFNDRKEYHDFGVDKSMMIIPKVRKKFVLGKIIANSSIMLIVIFGPILLFTIILGVFDHFGNMSYPLLANKKGLSQLYYPFFDGVYGPSSLQQSIDTGIITNFGISYTSGNMLFNPYMDFISLWQGILFGIVLFIPLIVFYVQINMFITRLIKNPYLALTINISLILLLIICSPLTSMNLMNTLNPLSYRDPVMNVIGTSYFPWLAGLLVVIFYNIVLYIGNKIIFSIKYYD